MFRLDVEERNVELASSVRLAHLEQVVGDRELFSRTRGGQTSLFADPCEGCVGLA